MDRPSLIEFRELNEYARHEASIYFTWLNFFLTIVLAAMSWALKASVDSSGRIPHFPIVLVVLLAFFMIQIVLGVGATNGVSADIARLEQRALYLLTAFDRAVPEAGYVPHPPLPRGYGRSVVLARRALIANLVFWPIVGAVVLWAWATDHALVGTPP